MVDAHLPLKRGRGRDDVFIPHELYCMDSIEAARLLGSKPLMHSIAQSTPPSQVINGTVMPFITAMSLSAVM